MWTDQWERQRTQRRRGSGLVELALVIPIFLMLVLGIAEFGWAFFADHVLATAAREGARVAVVTKPGEIVGQVNAKVTQVLAAANLNGAVVTVQPTNPSPTNLLPGDPVTVRVSLRYTPITGVTSDVFGLRGLRNLTLQKTVVMRYEG